MNPWMESKKQKNSPAFGSRISLVAGNYSGEASTNRRLLENHTQHQSKIIQKTAPGSSILTNSVDQNLVSDGKSGEQEAPSGSSIVKNSVDQELVFDGKPGKQEAPSGNSIYQPPVIQIAKVTYHNCLIGIFTDTEEKNPRRFFFEPVFLVDLKSIVSESRGFFKQNFIRFTVQMWNPDIRSKVLERLQSLPCFSAVNIQEEDVLVMPYEEIQLVGDPGDALNSIRLMDRPNSYLRSPESLNFYLLCDTSSVANELATDFREDPEFTMSSLRLELECRGLLLGTGTNPVELFASNLISQRPTYRFKPSVTGGEEKSPRLGIDFKKEIRDLQNQVKEYEMCPSNDHEKQIKELEGQVQKLALLLPSSKKHEQQIKDLQDQIREQNEEQIKDLRAQIQAINKKIMVPPSAVPIFSVLKCSNGANFYQNPLPLAFSAFDIMIKKEYGNFNLQSGLFTVNMPGVYKFNFNAHVQIVRDPAVSSSSIYHHKFELRVDGEPKAASYSTHCRESCDHFLPVRMSALLSLKFGETVGVFICGGKLYESPPSCTTRFSAILFTPK